MGYACSKELQAHEIEKQKVFYFEIRSVDLKYDVAMDDAQLYWNSGWCINLTVQWLTLFYCIALNFASTVDGALF